MRDAGNPWIFVDAGDAWDGVRFVAFSGSPEATHAVDVTETFDAGVKSLSCHKIYLANLGGDMASPDAFLRPQAESIGESLGISLGASFEIIR